MKVNPLPSKEFQVESDRAFIVLGHSERRRVGEFFATKLDERGLFGEIDVITLNQAAAKLGRKALHGEMKLRTVITHSAGITRIPAALQIIAINPPEQVSLTELIKRAMEIMNDPIVPEEGSHNTGFGDMIGAGFELVRSPASTIHTMSLIAKGYSAVRKLSGSANQFPGGRAIVHSELDGFGFSDLADKNLANMHGVTTITLPDHHHNEVLFAPGRTIDLMSPVIFPVN